MLIPIIEPAGIDLTKRRRRVAPRTRRAKHASGSVVLRPLYKMAHGDFEEVADAIIETIDKIRVDYGCAVILEAHSPHASGGGRRPKRPYGLSSFLRWPEFGFHLAEQGHLTAWRGARDATRPWPTVLRRGGDWRWTVATDSRAVTFARILETVQQKHENLSVRELAGHLGVGRNQIQRAIVANREQWNELVKDLD